MLIGIENRRKTGPYYFSKEARESFINLKYTFSQPPVLIHFDSLKKIHVKTDTSKFVIIGLISQQINSPNRTKKHQHLVAFWSYKLTGAKWHYTTYNSKLLTIIECFKKQRHYLKGLHYVIKVLTDYNNLYYFINTKYLESCQARQAIYLASYDFKIIY